MKGLFEKIKSMTHLGSKEDKLAVEQLTAILAPLANVDDSYPKRIMDYIFNADDPNILLELQNRSDDKAGVLMSFPGTIGYHWGSYRATDKEDKQIAKSIKMRDKFYQRIFKAMSPEQIIRYGKFLAAVTQLKNYKVLSPLSPEWFTYLIADGLSTSLERNNKSDIKHRNNWSHAHLFDVLKADEQNKNDSDAYHLLLVQIFERKEVDSYYSDNLHLLYQFPDTIELLQQHKAVLDELIPALSAKGQEQFIDSFAKYHPDFIKQCPYLVATLATSTSKTVRELALAKISLFEQAQIKPHLIELLTNGNTKQRREIADIIARQGAQQGVDGDDNSAESRNILEQALANEKQKSVIQALESALSRLDSVAQLAEVEYVVSDFDAIVSQDIPYSCVDILAQNYAELLEKKQLAAEQETEQNKTSDYKYTWSQKNYNEWKKLKPEQYGQKLIDALNGKGKISSLDNGNMIELCGYKNRLKNLPEFGLHHAVRLAKSGGSVRNYQLENYIKPENLATIELRQYAQVLKDCQIENPNRGIAEEYLENTWSPLLLKYINKSEQIVPFFMEHLDYISEALGLLPNKSENRWREFEPSKAISILATFPQIPKQFIPKILELALGENKRLRHDAQELLSHLLDIHQRAIEALANGKQAIRVTAVEWLARLNERDDSHKAEVLKALYDLLKKEKKEIVIASILTALESMGEDISKYLSPTALLKDAEKGLKGKVLKSFEWFKLDSLPAVQWQNGKTVNPKIIQWWVVLAEKLKDPMPNGLLQRYLGLLDDKSQRRLSLFLLQSFISEDTLNPTLAQAMEIANAEAPARLSQYQDYYKRYGQKDPDSWAARYANVTLHEMVEEIKKEQLAIYLGSAIKSKGMLALTYRAEGSTAVNILQDYMKNHYRRTSQITAMLTVFAISDDPLIIQLLLGLSRRYRTSSIQDLAKQLVGTIAERNNWTADELADRTIPTAGLDENGILTIDYDTRTLSAYVDDKDKFVLKNEAGKVIKSLPAARQNDDAAIIKEAKTLFSNSKKEFKQVVDSQTTRLYEAMCSERLWTSSDWQEYLYAHPIMKRLITHLIWIEVDGKQGGEGKQIVSFRPSDDGSLLDFNDDEISLQADSYIKLAHGVLLTAEECDQWREHLTDYEIKSLFGKFTQFDHALPAFKKEQDQIDEFKGYLTDTFTLRGLLTKMGYKRASIEDGGSFDRYYKNYDSLGLSAVIVFSGSYVPEENIPAVLYELGFETKQSYSWNTDYVALTDVNPILLAESYAEYKTVADATGGFDADWEKKTPW